MMREADVYGHVPAQISTHDYDFTRPYSYFQNDRRVVHKLHTVACGRSYNKNESIEIYSKISA